MSNTVINNYRRYRTLSIILSMLAAVGAGAPAYAEYACEHRSDDKSGAKAFFDHASDLHDHLTLTESQEPAWRTFLANMQLGGYPATTAAASPIPVRFDRTGTIMNARLHNMEFRAIAIDGFYGQLTASQQLAFDEFFSALRDRREQH